MAQAAAGAQRRRYPLAVHISTLFVVLLAVAGLAIGALAYFRSVAILTRAADDLFDRVARETTHEVQRIATPGEALLDVLAQTRIATAGNLVERLDALALVREGFAVSPNISAIYAGYANGDFFLVRRVPDAPEAREALGAPERAAYLVQSIERRGQERGLGTFVWFDADLARLGIESRPGVHRLRPAHPPVVPRRVQRGGSDQDRAVRLLHHARGGRHARAPRRRTEVGGRHGHHAAGDRGGARAPADHARNGDRARGRRRARDCAPRSRARAPAGAARAGAGASRRWPRSVRRCWPRWPGGCAAAGKEAQIAEIDAGGRAWRTLVAPLALRGVEIAPRLVFAMPLDELLVEARRIARDSGAAVAMVLAAALLAALAAASAISRPLRRLVDEANAIRRFEFSRPVEVASIVKEVDELAGTMDEMKRTIRRFLDVSAAVAAEPDLDRLMPRLLDETIAAAGAQGGVLYLAADDGATLTPAAVRIAGGGTDVATLPPIDLAREPPGHPVPKAVRAGIAQAYSVRRGDAATADLDVLLAAFGDERATLVVAPLANRRRELLGVVAILCPERAGVERELVEFVGALAGASAVSLETKQLIQAQKALLDAFIRLIAGAIDAKIALHRRPLRSACRSSPRCSRAPPATRTTGRSRTSTSTRTSGRRCTSPRWLHDCGKVTTPEYVVDKATKLETIYDRIHEVRMRFEVLKRDAEIAYLEAGRGRRRPSRAAGDARGRDGARSTTSSRSSRECNDGGEFMAPEQRRAAEGDRRAHLAAHARRPHRHLAGGAQAQGAHARRRRCRRPSRCSPTSPSTSSSAAPRTGWPTDNRWGFKLKMPELLYNRGELYNLVGRARHADRRGALQDQRSHRADDHHALGAAVPAPSAPVPEIAGGHHEKMDGTGYPKRLTRDEMSPVARIMAIADIFEALTAADRPYKKGKTLSEAIKIMGFMTQGPAHRPGAVRALPDARACTGSTPSASSRRSRSTRWTLRRTSPRPPDGGNGHAAYHSYLYPTP